MSQRQRGRGFTERFLPVRAPSEKELRQSDVQKLSERMNYENLSPRDGKAEGFFVRFCFVFFVCVGGYDKLFSLMHDDPLLFSGGLTCIRSGHLLPFNVSPSHCPCKHFHLHFFFFLVLFLFKHTSNCMSSKTKQKIGTQPLARPRLLAITREGGDQGICPLLGRGARLEALGTQAPRPAQKAAVTSRAAIS